jgi:hypothetical protein
LERLKENALATHPYRRYRLGHVSQVNPDDSIIYEFGADLENEKNANLDILDVIHA